MSAFSRRYNLAVYCLFAEGFHPLSGRSTEDSSFVVPKAVDLEEADRETTNLLVFLLMQFLSR